MKKYITVFGLKTEIIYQELDDSLNAVAIYEPSTNRIILDPRSKTTFQDFCHEIFHLFWYRTGMRQYVIDPNVEEIIAENFSILMLENLPDIVSVLNKINKKNVKKKTRK